MVRREEDVEALRMRASGQPQREMDSARDTTFRWTHDKVLLSFAKTTNLRTKVYRVLDPDFCIV